MHRTILYLICTTFVTASAHHKTTLLEFEPPQVQEMESSTCIAPVTFSHEGLEEFFTHRYNTRYYSDVFLPCCFAHLLDFLAQAYTTRDPHTFAIASIDTFHQRLKEATWVNPYALSQLLEHVPDYIGPLCQQQEAQSAYQAILHDAILYDFETLKKDPQTFFEKTSQALTRLDEARETVKDVQLRTTRLIEAALDKIIFSPHEQFTTWHMYLTIGHQLEHLYDQGIIPGDTELNHLLWSLTYRYGHFLEAAGAYLTLETYRDIRASLESDEAAFLDHEEIEAYMIDKRQYLLKTLAHGYAQSRSRQEGGHI